MLSLWTIVTTKMCQNILNNIKCYRKISPSLVDKFNKEFFSLVDESLNEGVITRDTWDFIRTRHPHLPMFYALPKVHKDPYDRSGRPIISGNGCISEGISQVIDQHLRPHVMDLPSYTKDTIHLLQILDSLVVSDSAILVTVDV